MTYRLEFKVSALKEWQKLDRPIREQFKKKLIERLEQPRVEASRLAALPDCYKLKLRAAGYRLGYQVVYATITVILVPFVKPEDRAAYLAPAKRIN